MKKLTLILTAILFTLIAFSQNVDPETFTPATSKAEAQGKFLYSATGTETKIPVDSIANWFAPMIGTDVNTEYLVGKVDDGGIIKSRFYQKLSITVSGGGAVSVNQPFGVTIDKIVSRNLYVNRDGVSYGADSQAIDAGISSGGSADYYIGSGGLTVDGNIPPGVFEFIAEVYYTK